MTETIERLLRGHTFFQDLDPGYLALLVGCATNVQFDERALLMREGEQADRFYLIRRGKVAVEIAGGPGTSSSCRPLPTVTWPVFVSVRAARIRIRCAGADPVLAFALDGYACAANANKTPGWATNSCSASPRSRLQRLQATPAAAARHAQGTLPTEAPGRRKRTRQLRPGLHPPCYTTTVPGLLRPARRTEASCLAAGESAFGQEPLAQWRPRRWTTPTKTPLWSTLRDGGPRSSPRRASREGFGLTVAKGLWKDRPVAGSADERDHRPDHRRHRHPAARSP